MSNGSQLQYQKQLYHLEDLSRRISGFGRVLFVSEQCVLAPSGSMGSATITPTHSRGQISKFHREDDQAVSSHHPDPTRSTEMLPGKSGTHEWKETADSAIRWYPFDTPERSRPDR